MPLLLGSLFIWADFVNIPEPKFDFPKERKMKMITIAISLKTQNIL
jgi:hypothetical protein